MLPSPYGHFQNAGRAFRITDPQTPTPWTNVVCNGRYGFIVSQSGGGFSWLDNSQLNVLTRWDMDLIRDAQGKFLYLADLDDDTVWSLAPMPCRTPYQTYACEHTLGATTFLASYAGIRWSWQMSVAPEDPVELWRVLLTNESDRPRRLRIASAFEWCCGVAPDVKREFHKLFITTEHDRERDAIIATKNMWDVPAKHRRDHWNQPWPYAAAHAVSCTAFERKYATADKASFLGRAADPTAPAWLRSPSDGRFGRFLDDMASLGGDLSIEPGESVELHYVLTVAETPDAALALVDRYRLPETAREAAAASTGMWDRLVRPDAVHTSEPAFNALVGAWLPYQAVAARLWGRVGYYQQSGAYGYRDQLQDSQVWLPIEPDRCRDQILLHAAHQFAEGRVYHWWHPLTEQGLETECSDDYLWLPFVCASYIRETGDLSILDETAPYVDEAREATIAEHCERSIAKALDRLGQNELPRIGTCDWNDGLSGVGVEEKGESVWLAFFLADILREWSRITGLQGKGDRAGEILAAREQLLKAANTTAWDGRWFRRAITDDGEWLGSADCSEGSIYLNPQTWAILTDGAPEDRLRTAWDSVREHLLREMGPLLLYPAYTEPRTDIGYITRYSPGSRENGGVYMHAAVWALAAACKRGDTEAVRRIWRAIAPPIRSTENPDGYAAEPYVTPGNVDGPLSDTPGRAGWTWYTGSAAWLYRVCLERVLGLRADWDGLRIDPCVFPELGEIRVKRRWRGRTIDMHLDATDAKAGVEPRVMVDGRHLEGNLLREQAYPEGATLQVHLTWSSPEVRRVRPTAAERSVS
ncbi:MAG: glycosyl transferase family 36 [Planctomycetota bacterium]